MQMNLGVDTHDKYTAIIKGKDARLHISRRAPGTVGLVEKPKEYEIKFVRINNTWKIRL